jgi:hypothetical protein
MDIELVFGEADDACGMPATIATMKVVLNAPVQNDSLLGMGDPLRAAALSCPGVAGASVDSGFRVPV